MSTRSFSFDKVIVLRRLLCSGGSLDVFDAIRADLGDQRIQEEIDECHFSVMIEFFLDPHRRIKHHQDVVDIITSVVQLYGSCFSISKIFTDIMSSKICIYDNEVKRFESFLYQIVPEHEYRAIAKTLYYGVFDWYRGGRAPDTILVLFLQWCVQKAKLLPHQYYFERPVEGEETDEYRAEWLCALWRDVPEFTFDLLWRLYREELGWTYTSKRLYKLISNCVLRPLYMRQKEEELYHQFYSAEDK